MTPKAEEAFRQIFRSLGIVGARITDQHGVRVISFEEETMPKKWRPKLPEEDVPVGVEECRHTILRALLQEFQGRHLSWEVATQAMALAAFDVKQMALIETARRKP